MSHWCYLIAVSAVTFMFSFKEPSPAKPAFPYKQAGLTEKQAAAHLLSRFTFGATPGQVDEVAKMGLENWFNQQLNAELPDSQLQAKLQQYDALNLSNREVAEKFPRPARVLQMALAEGVITKPEIDKAEKQYLRNKLRPFMEEKGFRPQVELFRQFASQKILRSVYSNNQLREVMTDFWFNHFNVSLVKRECAPYVPAYERDVIRPNVFGNFSTLLLATAKSPAMLLYLDNFSSAGTNNNLMAMNGRMQLQNASNENTRLAEFSDKLNQQKKVRGLNENYAREVMELHTLGVDGGYTQADVTEAAKILTGWTVVPGTEANRKQRQRIGTALNRLNTNGSVNENDFLFAANRHQGGDKKVLQKVYAESGYNEGVELLSDLAQNAATAQHICAKIATHFVNDNPPATLVDRLSKTFLSSNGNIKQVLMALVASPEFWSKTAVREKTKSPYELAISSIRALNATVDRPYVLYQWIEKMGQKVYYYQAPTGFPDKATIG